MDILVISNTYDLHNIKIGEDLIEIIRLHQIPTRDYTDYHAIIIDSRNYDEYTHFGEKISWNHIEEAMMFGAVVLVIIDSGFFGIEKSVNIPLPYKLRIEIRKSIGKNIRINDNQKDFLIEYIKKAHFYQGYIANCQRLGDGNYYIKNKCDTQYNLPSMPAKKLGTSAQRVVLNKFQPIALTEMKKTAIGGLIEIENGGKMLILPPVEEKDERVDISYLHSIITKLGIESDNKGVIIYDWVKNFDIGKEKALKESERNLEEKLQEIKSELTNLMGFKKMLCLKNDKLIEPIILLFNSLGIKTFRKEKFEEDFWICDEVGKKAIICEVKGTRKSIARKHINNLDNHREMSDLSAEFPSLLIANTFSEATSLKEKDADISPDIIKHAVNNNILIIRTLDLLRLFGHISNKKMNVNKLINLLECNVGWLKTTETDFEIRGASYHKGKRNL